MRRHVRWCLDGPTQGAPPEPGQPFPKRVQGGAIQRDTVIPVVPEHDRAQIRALLRNGSMQALPHSAFTALSFARNRVRIV